MGIFRSFLMAFGLSVAFFGQSQAQGIPPLISFQDGKLGVNFFGYHAAVGLGGNSGQGGAAGGLHAEAGTPFGQRAAAGLRGSAGQGGHSAGELYAGATAGGNIKAAAGLGGAVVGGDQPIAFGNKYAVAGSPGGVSGASENGFSNGVSKYVESTVVESKAPIKRVTEIKDSVDYSAEVGHQANFAPQPAASQGSVSQQGHQLEIDQAVKQYNLDNRNEVVVVKTKGLRKRHHVRPHKRVHYVVEQEVPPEVVHETTVYHQKAAAVPAFNSFGSAYLDTFLSPGYTHPAPAVHKEVVHYAAPAPVVHEEVVHYASPAPVVHKEVVHYAAPAVQKRVSYQASAGVDGGTFFQDIFNIPISTLSAVSKFLSNGAQSVGNVHVQKTVSLHSR